MQQDSDRFDYLDGLRGIACMMVVADHYSSIFQPARPLLLYDDGHLAVAIFFLMSGFVLTSGFAQPGRIIWAAISARLVRLLLPAAAALLIASAGEMHSHGATPLLRDLAALLLGYQDTSEFPFCPLGKIALSTNPPIWTVSYEIYGSILTLGLARLYRRNRGIWAVAIAAALAVLGIRELGLFVIGHVLRVLWRPEQAAACNRAALLLGFSTFTLFAAMHIDLYKPRPALDAVTSGLTPHISYLHAPHAAAGTIIFAVVLCSAALQKLLRMKPLLEIGRLSYSIYLIHWPLMAALIYTPAMRYAGNAIYTAFGTGSQTSVWIIFSIGAAVTVLAARIFARSVDAPSIALGRKIRARLSVISAGAAAPPPLIAQPPSALATQTNHTL